MADNFIVDEELIGRLPLPLAQLYRRAHNAKSAWDRHQNAYFLWEASLKLLGSVAIARYTQSPDADAQLAERLRYLARPALGHWWEFVRRLLPILADRADADFVNVRDLILGRRRDDLPRLAGLDAVLQGTTTARATVCLTELLDRFVEYRNREWHGATGLRSDEHYERLGSAFLAGFTELLGHLDVLAGYKLLYLHENRQARGVWVAARYELVGENPRRIPSLEIPRQELSQVPDGERVYLVRVGPTGEAGPMVCLHPLVVFDLESAETMFLNGRRGQKRADYLCYTTGRNAARNDLDTAHCEFLARLLNLPVSPPQLAAWAESSVGDEASEQTAESCRTRMAGEFELLSELGRGGMGVVFRAWQPSLRRQVAVKELLRVGEAKHEVRFKREIRALARVEHPNLVKIHMSASDGNQWFFAMELIEGAPLSAVWEQLRIQKSSVIDLKLETWHQTLTTVCEEARKNEKPLSDAGFETAGPVRRHDPSSTLDGVPLIANRSYLRQIVALMAQVTDAAHALHKKSIIHRDIKPSNIMISADGAQAVLMDLGLARITDDEKDRLTRSRQFVGTLPYASPQQVLAIGELDFSTDIYSLGATLYELLSLRPLFVGDNDKALTEEQLAEKIQHTVPVPLDCLQPGMPPDLAAIVSKCLEKSPEHRYATAEKLARDLRRFLRGDTVHARPVGRLERSRRWIKQYPATAAVYGLMTVVFVLLLIMGWGLWQMLPSAIGPLANGPEKEAGNNPPNHKLDSQPPKDKRNPPGGPVRPPVPPVDTLPRPDRDYIFNTRELIGWLPTAPEDYAKGAEFINKFKEAFMRRDWATGQATLKVLMSDHPKHADFTALQGIIFAEQEKWAEALEAFDEACELNEKEAAHFEHRALILAAQGKKQGNMYRTICDKASRIRKSTLQPDKSDGFPDWIFFLNFEPAQYWNDNSTKTRTELNDAVIAHAKKARLPQASLDRLPLPTQFFLAISAYKRDKSFAEETLTRARAELATQTIRHNNMDLQLRARDSVPWQERIIWQVLRNEAAALIDPKPR